MKDFFQKPPVGHDLEVGCLVTCACHGGVALVLELYDQPDEEDYPNMNMAKIWWITYPHPGVKERIWMHTIDRMRLRTTL